MSNAFILIFFLLYRGGSSYNTERKDNSGFSQLKTETTNWQSVEDTPDNLSRHRLKESVVDYDRPLFPMNRFPAEPANCTRPAKCQTLNYTSCFGARLPYRQTSLDLIEGLASQEQAQEQLEEWRRLIHIPKCWAVIQPFLCALYMPKCNNNMVFLPSQEMCKMILGPCRILATYESWPPLFKCENHTRYPPMCKYDVREIKFNSTGRCLEPLVPTDAGFYEGVEGCGVQCSDPMLSHHERRQIHKLVAWAATVCALFNLFTIGTFMIDWRSSSKYPALVVFYINMCFLLVCLGWLAQFLPGGREDIVCRKDGTLRVGEPSAGENLSCVVVFVMVYYFLMAGVVWFVILTYAWHISFKALGKIQECMEKKGAYFHLVAWSLPLVLTIATMALGEIDGNSVAGVCFVGYVHPTYRAGFLLLPLFAALTIGTYFMSKGLVILIRLKMQSEEIISQRASAKIRETIVRVGMFTALVLVFGATTFICHLYEFKNKDSWQNSFRAYILCRLGVRGVEGGCRMQSTPSLAVQQLHILALFSSGVVMSSWVWTHSTVLTWQRFIRRMLDKETEGAEPMKLKKHKVIAQAYSKRRMLSNDGRLSISIHDTYQDPVGLKFELNSEASGSLSSTWAAALPKLVTRRGALITPATNSNSSHRRSSMDSEISYSVCRVSVESRRHSVESAVSVKVSEVTQTLVKKVSTPLQRSRQRRRRKPSRNRRRNPRQIAQTASSHDSNLAMQLLSVLASSDPPVKIMLPNMGRRAASAGLDNNMETSLDLPTVLQQLRMSSESRSSKASAK